MRAPNERPSRGLAQGHRWRHVVQMVLRTYGTTCHICGHAGARQADHLTPLTEDDSRALDITDMRPAHGASRGRGANPCEVCSAAAGKPVYCNTIRQAMSVERARRIIRERTGLPMPGDPDFSTATVTDGREW